MTLQELTGQEYLVYFDVSEQLSYQTCSDMIHTLNNRFPNKTFIGIVKGIEFQELDDEDIESFISILTQIQQKRGEEKNNNIVSQELAKTLINNSENP